MGVNHLAHALLVRELGGLLRARPSSPSPGPGSPARSEDNDPPNGTGRERIIILTSDALHIHPPSGIPFATLRTKPGYFGSWLRYGQSKLANVLYARELARRCPEVTVLAIHPGVVKTGMWGQLSIASRALVWVSQVAAGGLVGVEEGAWNSVWAVSVSEEEVASGGFYRPVGVLVEGGALGRARDDGLAGRLWEWTEGVLEKY